MCFIFSSRNEGLCHALYQEIAEIDDQYFYYSDGLQLLKNVTNNYVVGDVLLLDYQFYKEFSRFVYDVLIAKNLKIPIILFGNPKYSAKERIQYWIAENEAYYDIQNVHRLIPVFQKINSALEHVSQDQASSDFSHTSAKDLKIVTSKIYPVEEICQEMNLTPCVHRLLLFFLRKRGREVSLEEIALCMCVKNCCKKERNNSAYAYISRLKKCLEKSQTAKMYNLKIVRTRKGYYKLILKQ